MKTFLHWILLTGTLVLLSGCLPEERLWWSPQGDRALVLIDGRLHLTTADGTLGEALTEAIAEGQVLVQTASWLPDGSGFVCQRVRLVPTWEELRKLITDEETTTVEQMLPAVPGLLDMAKLAAQGKSLRDVVHSLPVTNKKALEVAIRRRFQEDAAQIEGLLRTLPNGAEVVAGLHKDGAAFALNELCVHPLSNGDAKAAPVSLVRSLLTPLLLPRVSPRHHALAFLRLDAEEEHADLEVMTLDGRGSLTAARNVSAAFDWTPDGRGLVFMAPIGGDGEKLHSIHHLAVLQENGALLKPVHERQTDGSAVKMTGPDRLAPPVTLATAVTLNKATLQVLADGRVLFASHAITLPAAGTGGEPEPRLNTVTADGKTVQPVPTAAGDLPTNLGWFAASPDGKRVAVVESETDAVAVVEVDTGKTQIISPPHPRWQCRTVPAWKSATELTFAGLHEGAPACLVWSEAGGLRRLSTTWPASATAKWLEQKKEEPAAALPAAKPASAP